MTKDKNDLNAVDLEGLFISTIDGVVSSFAAYMTPPSGSVILTEARLYCAIVDACDRKAKMAAEDRAMREELSSQDKA